MPVTSEDQLYPQTLLVDGPSTLDAEKEVENDKVRKWEATIQ